MSTPQDVAPNAGIGPFLISARSFAEYTAMFALTDADLAGAVLDCPGGASSFTATALSRGIDVTATDPAYAGGQAGLRALGKHAISEAHRGSAFLLDQADRYTWTYFNNPAEHLRERIDSATRFSASAEADPQRYVPGALPQLPFPDRCFDLVLCSHLLFTYDDRFDEPFHLAALTELTRISRGEIRIFPLLSHVDGKPYPHLDNLRRVLEARGISNHVRHVDYEFQRGGNKMLVLTARPSLDDSTNDNTGVGR